MQRRIPLAALALAAILAAAVLPACSDDSGSTDPDIADPDQLDLVIVSGDGQVAPVADPASASSAFAPAQTTPDNILPEPLVARITVDGAEPSAVVASGLSFAVLPPNVSVTFRVVDHPDAIDGRHCGASFVDAAIPDDSGYVVTFWERGTLAATCEMEVRLIIDGQPRVDTVFTATFEPGPVTAMGALGEGLPLDVSVGDTIDLSLVWAYGLDAYGNHVDMATVVATVPAAIAWGPIQPSGQICRGGEGAGEPTAGWTTTVPAEALDWPVSTYDGYNACMHIWVAGTLMGAHEFRVR